jgi:hypothetical protein
MERIGHAVTSLGIGIEYARVPCIPKSVPSVQADAIGVMLPLVKCLEKCLFVAT